MRDIRNMEPAWERIAASKFRLGSYKDANGQPEGPRPGVPPHPRLLLPEGREEGPHLYERHAEGQHKAKKN